MRQTLSESAGGQPEAMSNDEAYAVIGMACRLPGSATSLEGLWEMLESGRSAWTPEPPDGRFIMSRFYDPQIGKSGSLFTKGAHFLKEDVALFDRKFFNISAIEAAAMDPHVRLLLEIAYETFENAGYSLNQLADSQTGVFVGSWSRDYHLHLERDPENAPMYESTGTAASIVSNRISHFFDLKGPSFTVDTACSSSLVALHQAVLSMKNGDAKTAFVGGVNLILDPVASMALGRMRLLSPDGRSYAFDQRANGYGRGEGVGGVLLKPLRAAQKDGDAIRAIIRSSALNQDGFTPGITMPSAMSQERAIRRAYDSAKLHAEADYVECHGTGTAVGDPIETRAISAVLAQNRPANDPLIVGSVKSSIGHLEAAAGIASIIKAVLMLEKGIIPPQALLQNPTAAIDWDDLRLKPSSELVRDQTLNRISINSFGFGGANAHVIVERAVDQSGQRATEHQEIPCLAVLTAASEKGCKHVAAALGRFVVEHPELEKSTTFCRDLAYTLSKRSLLQHRVALTYSNIHELLERLDQVQSGMVPIEKASCSVHTAYVFTGQGAQWFAMARELLNGCEVFRTTIDRAASVFKRLYSSWDLVDELSKSEQESRINDPELSQPISTAVQVAIVELMKSVNIMPCAVVGHSSGELAAAYAADAITFEDVLTSAYYRGLLVGEAIRQGTCKGQMLAVGLGAEKTEEYIAQIPQEIGECIVACHNSPSSVTVSGDEAAVTHLHKALQADQIFSRLLKTNGAAYHSHHMRPIGQKLSELLSSIYKGTPKDVRWVSSVFAWNQTGREIDGQYWVTNLVSPVLFPQALEKVCKDEAGQSLINNLVEIGPHSALAGPIKQILKSTNQMQTVRYTNALTRGQNAMKTFLDMVGTLAIRGLVFDLDSVHKLFGQVSPKFLTNLPSYPWDHESKFWHNSRLGMNYRGRPFPRHELLGVQSSDFNLAEPSWRNYVRLGELPWLKGHAVHGQVIWPGAGYVTMAAEAVRQVSYVQGHHQEDAKYVLRDIVLSRALVLREEDDDIEINFKMRPQPICATDSSAVWNEFRVFTLSKGKEPQEHCRGLIAVEGERLPNMAVPTTAEVEDIRRQSSMEIDPADFYRIFRQQGMEWRNVFAGLTSISAGPGTSFCTVREWPLSPEESGTPAAVSVHPGTLDSIFQASFAPMIAVDHPAANVITSIDQLEIKINSSGQYGRDLQIHCVSTDRGFDIGTKPDNSLPFHINIQGFHLTEVAGEVDGTSSHQQTCFNLEWEQISEEALGAMFPAKVQGLKSSLVKSTQQRKPSVDSHAKAYSLERDLEQSPDEIHGLGPVIRLIGANSGFISDLCTELREAEDHAVVEAAGWWKTMPANSTYIVLDTASPSLLSHMRKDGFEHIQNFIKQATNILWLTCGSSVECTNPDASTVTGFAATLRVENPALRLVTLDVDRESLTKTVLAGVISRIISGRHFDANVNFNELNCDLAFRQGQWLAPHIAVNGSLTRFLAERSSIAETSESLFFQDNRPLYLMPGEPGLLDTLRWKDQELTDLIPQCGEVIFETRAHGVNFRDLLVTIGQLGSGKDAVMAGECSGIVIAVGPNLSNEFQVGDRVAAFGAQPYANFARVPGHRCIKLPESISFEVAASIPIVVSTVVYALLHISRIEKGSKVLIHSASGGVGQAAVMLAHYVGAEVFATAGNANKRRLLVEEYGVAEDHIFSSRDSAFQQQVMKLTDGTGVDVVLNSLTGEMFRESCNCLASFGHFVEIGKRDLIANSRMEMRFFLKNVSFTAMDLMVIGKQRPRLCKQLLTESMALVASGSIKPIRMIQAPLSEVVTKFREMQAGKHVGKIVLTCDRETVVKAVPKSSKTTDLKGDASYLIIGGLGGLGRTIIRWMAARGAKNIVTMSRKGSRSAHAANLTREMQSKGVNLKVLECDVSSSVKSSLDGVNPPIRGVVQAAMVLQDSIFEHMTYEQWTAATLPKIQGTRNLHEYFSNHALDFFVMLSSVVSVVGNAGQTAYSAANSYLDGLARHRNSMGLTGHSINVGVVSDAGVVSQNEDLAKILASRGYSTITVKDLLHVIDHALSNAEPTTPTLSQTVMGLGTDLRALNSPKFASWLDACGVQAHEDSKGVAKYDLRLAGSPQEAQRIACAALVHQIGKLLSIDPIQIDSSHTLASYGIDSLISVDLRNWLKADLKAAVPLLELNENGRTISDLAKLVATRSSLVQNV